jgi:recombination protein U
MNKTIHNEEKFVEKYPDPTAAQAIENITRENRKSRKQLQGHRSRSVGKSFEAVIDQACKRYIDLGVANIEKTPEPMKQIGGMDRRGQFKACYEHRAQPDYKGTIKNGKAVVFEAKATESHKIKKDAVKPWQFESLDSHWKIGAEVFVLVCFELEHYFRVPWGIWREMETLYGRKYLKKEEIEDCSIKFKNGYLHFLGETGEK